MKVKYLSCPELLKWQHSVLFLIATFASMNSYADAVIQMEFCTNESAAVLVVAARGAKYLGVTVTLSNGDYYDFPAEAVNQLIPRSFTLPSNYRAVSWEARLWEKKKNSKKAWSDRVVNPQGYVMKKPVGVSVRCNP